MSGLILASASYDHKIKLWNPTEGRCQRTITHADSQVNRLSITPDCKYLAAGGNPQIRLYDIRTAHSEKSSFNFEGHRGNVTALGFHKDAKWMFSGSEDGTAKVWDYRARGWKRDYESRGSAPINDVVLHPNQGELAIGDRNGILRVVDLSSNKIMKEVSMAGKIPSRKNTVTPT